MKIEVLVQGDPDIKPFTKIYHYEKSDELIFFESTQLIKKTPFKQYAVKHKRDTGVVCCRCHKFIK